MLNKYSKIKPGSVFNAKEGQYRKIDDLYYEDLTTGFQSVWSPIFDASIIVPKTVDAEKTTDSTNTKDKFIVEPQTRMIKPNPDYRDISDAERAFSEMWGSGNFDCGPEDYEFMSSLATAASAVMSILAECVGLTNDMVHYPAIAGELIHAYREQQNPPSKAKKPVKGRSTKKSVATKKKKPAKGKR